MRVRVDADEDLTGTVPEFAAVPTGSSPYGASWAPGSWSSSWRLEGFGVAEAGSELGEGDVWLRLPMVGQWLVGSS